MKQLQTICNKKRLQTIYIFYVLENKKKKNLDKMQKETEAVIYICIFRLPASTIPAETSNIFRIYIEYYSITTSKLSNYFEWS